MTGESYFEISGDEYSGVTENCAASCNGRGVRGKSGLDEKE